jgi:prepilin-type N-terminal cleavage/methylation domain-containing protein/prepilin-type processing-associated H-X9-DG protein
MRRHRASGGFTLVELLVVITIIGILISLLLPAVNSARESGRSAQCKNNLKQLATAILAHEEAQGIFPTGGWGWHWVGDPDRGYGMQQPGGWIYNILPHTELTALHDLGRYGDSATKQAAIVKMVGTPLPITNCPTRRRPALYPMRWGTRLIGHNAGGTNAPTDEYMVARTDYAVNTGAQGGDEIGGGPAAGADSLPPAENAAQKSYFGTRAITNPTTYSGICYEQSTLRKDDVSDGLSNTALVGEKYLGTDAYGTGKVGADNENMYVGFDNDIGRTTSKSPMQDRWGINDTLAFGSAHPNTTNFVMCDGSVFTVNYSVDFETYKRLGTRAEGSQVDLTKL